MKAIFLINEEIPSSGKITPDMKSRRLPRDMEAKVPVSSDVKR